MIRAHYARPLGPDWPAVPVGEPGGVGPAGGPPIGPAGGAGPIGGTGHRQPGPADPRQGDRQARTPNRQAGWAGAPRSAA